MKTTTSLKDIVLIADLVNGIFGWVEDQDAAAEYIAAQHSETNDFFSTFTMKEAIDGDYLTPRGMAAVLMNKIA